jgi:hypothetical protein
MTGVMPATERDHRREQGSDNELERELLHPRWTHAPLGGLVLVAVFDVISAAAGSTRP